MPYHTERADSRSRPLSSAKRSHTLLPTGQGSSRGASCCAPPGWPLLPGGSSERLEQNPRAGGKPASSWKCWYAGREQTPEEGGEAIGAEEARKGNGNYGNESSGMVGLTWVYLRELRYLRQKGSRSSKGRGKLNHCRSGFWCPMSSPLK